jgi:hypothetical protein
VVVLGFSFFFSGELLAVEVVEVVEVVDVVVVVVVVGKTIVLSPFCSRFRFADKFIEAFGSLVFDCFSLFFSGELVVEVVVVVVVVWVVKNFLFLFL